MDKSLMENLASTKRAGAGLMRRILIAELDDEKCFAPRLRLGFRLWRRTPSNPAARSVHR
ncbi:hypothetical protein CH337_09150 [Rhodoblastus acidophilus]|nr:hypothetical protein CKO16_09055 [Rhodoblastus acidophilus]RAI20785.1 hypothetical protein CH337_09150 [Rhodoblastus acidophilus]